MHQRRDLEPVHIARSHAEAADWDVRQQLAMTPDERQAAARELKRRVYGSDAPDVRESHRQA